MTHGAAYTFTVDGEAAQASIWVVDGLPDDPAPGDVASLAEFAFVLDDTLDLQLHSSLPLDGLVRREAPDGSMTVIAARIGHVRTEADSAAAEPVLIAPDENVETADDDDADQPTRFLNPLASLSEDALRGIRGVLIHAHEGDLPEIIATLGTLDLARCVITLSLSVESVAMALKLLPLDIAYLALSPSSYGAHVPLDLSRLRGMTRLKALSCPILELTDDTWLEAKPALRHLDLRTIPDTFLRDVRPLRRLRALRLHMPSSSPDLLSKITQLTDLVDLDLNGLDIGATPTAIASLVQLRRLDVRRCGIEDASMLAGLRHLEIVLASMSAISRLPDVPMPSLRLLDLIGCPVSSEDVRSFCALNPGCDVRHGYGATLLAAVGHADRIRVRSGGTCHRRIAEEVTLFEETRPGPIAAFLNALSFDDARSGERCMCCGDPTVEFYSGTRLLGALGLHHGIGARFDQWPGDGRLTDEARLFLAGWLAERGAPEFRQASLEQRRAEQLTRRLWKRYATIVGPEVQLSTADDQATSAQRITEALEDPTERAIIALQLAGAGFGAWNHRPVPGLLSPAFAVLRDIPRSSWPAVIKQVLHNCEALDGLARWVLLDDGHEYLGESLNKYLCDLMAHALTHPRSMNRHMVLTLLIDTRSEFTDSALRWVVEGSSPRELDPDWEALPPGMVTHGPLTAAATEGVSIEARAALELAKRGLNDCSSKIARLAHASSCISDAPLYEEAMRLFNSRPKSGDAQLVERDLLIDRTEGTMARTRRFTTRFIQRIWRRRPDA